MHFIVLLLLVSISAAAPDILIINQLIYPALSGGTTGTFTCSDCNVSSEPLPCQWDSGAVRCDAGGKCLWLELSNLNLNGTIPTEINQLTKLVALILNHNDLHGTLPLINITSLVDLLVSSNLLNGTIPSVNQLPNLRSLWLGFNFFSGQMPSFDGMSNLRQLYMAHNYLSGTVNVPSALNLWDCSVISKGVINEHNCFDCPVIELDDKCVWDQERDDPCTGTWHLTCDDTDAPSPSPTAVPTTSPLPFASMLPTPSPSNNSPTSSNTSSESSSSSSSSSSLWTSTSTGATNAFDEQHSSASDKNQSMSTYIVIGICICLCVFILLVVIVIACLARRRRRTRVTSGGGSDAGGSGGSRRSAAASRRSAHISRRNSTNKLHTASSSNASNAGSDANHVYAIAPTFSSAGFATAAAPAYGTLVPVSTYGSSGASSGHTLGANTSNIYVAPPSRVQYYGLHPALANNYNNTNNNNNNNNNGYASGDLGGLNAQQKQKQTNYINFE